jgi:hypothetical protein
MSKLQEDNVQLQSTLKGLPHPVLTTNNTLAGLLHAAKANTTVQVLPTSTHTSMATMQSRLLQQPSVTDDTKFKISPVLPPKDRKITKGDRVNAQLVLHTVSKLRTTAECCSHYLQHSPKFGR